MLKFHHVGIACKDIDVCSKQYKKQFHMSIVSESNTVYDREQNANLKIITLVDGSSVEFISGAMVDGLLKNKRDIYHVCYESSDFEQDIDEFIMGGGIPISKVKPAVLFDGRKVQFFMTSYGMVEILDGNQTS